MNANESINRKVLCTLTNRLIDLMIPDMKFDEIISHYDSPGDHDFCRPGWHIPTGAEMNDYNPSVSLYPCLPADRRRAGRMGFQSGLLNIRTGNQ